MSEAIDYLQHVVNSDFAMSGDSSAPFSGGYLYPVVDVEHPLKGLLKDKGAEAHLQFLEQQLEHYMNAARQLVKIVAKRNDEHGAPLLSLNLHKKTNFAWRSHGRLDSMTQFTTKSDRFYFFRKTYPYHRELKEFFKENEPELYTFYKAVDAVRSDIEVRLRITSRLITEFSKWNDVVMNDEEDLRISEKRLLAPILEDLNRRLLIAH